MLFKLLFAPDGKILGVQGLGQNGIAGRIDTIAAIIKSGGSVAQLEEAEICYASGLCLGPRCREQPWFAGAGGFERQNPLCLL